MEQTSKGPRSASAAMVGASLMCCWADDSTSQSCGAGHGPSSPPSSGGEGGAFQRRMRGSRDSARSARTCCHRYGASGCPSPVAFSVATLRATSSPPQRGGGEEGAAPSVAHRLASPAPPTPSSSAETRHLLPKGEGRSFALLGLSGRQWWSEKVLYRELSLDGVICSLSNRGAVQWRNELVLTGMII